MKVAQKQLDNIKVEVTNRIYIRFQDKFEGNKSKFARAAGVHESSIRDLLNGGQGMTLNMLFKLCSALDVSPSEILSGLEVEKKRD